MKKKPIHIFFVMLVLLAFFGHNYNSFFNGHFHLLNDGRWIYHAHPHEQSVGYPTSANPGHSHTRLESLTFELLLAAQGLLLFTFFVFKIFLFVFKIFHNFEYVFTTLFYRKFQPLRGPPLLSS